MGSESIVQQADVFDTVDQAAGAAQRKGVTTIGAFVTSLGLSLVILAVGTLLFVIGRNRYRRIYQPRSLLDSSKHFKVLPLGLAACLRTVLYDDQDLVHHSGIDAHLFLRFLAAMALYFGLSTVVACPILIPFNVIANMKGHARGLNLLRWTGIHTSSAYVTCHTLVIILLSAQLCWFIGCEWDKTLRLRERESWSPSNHHQHAVIVRCATSQPQHVCNRLIELYDHRNTNPKCFSQAYQSRVSNAQAQVHRARDKLEDQVIKLLSQSLRQQTSFSALTWGCDGAPWYRRFFRRCRGRAVYNPFTCASECRTAVRELKEAAQQESTESETTMVLLFDDPVSATLASLTQISPVPQVTADDTLAGCRGHELSNTSDRAAYGVPVRHRAGPSSNIVDLITPGRRDMSAQAVSARWDDINWKNLGKEDPRQWWKLWLTRVTLTRVSLYALILAWTFFIAISGSLSQLEALSLYVPWLRWLQKVPPSVLCPLQACLPSLLTSGLIALFQPVLRGIIATRGLISTCAEELAVHRYHFGFLWIHLFLTTSIASGLTAGVREITANPNAIMVLLADNLPQASGFFLVFVLFRVFVEAGTILAQSTSVINSIHFRWRTLTPRKLQQQSLCRIDNWGTTISIHTVLASIVIIYAPLAPLILPIGAVAFGLLWVAYRFFFLCIASGGGNSQGQLHLQTLSHLFIALCTQHACSIGVLILSDVTDVSATRIVNIALRAVALCISLLFYKHIRRKAYKHLHAGTWLSSELKNTDSGHLDNVAHRDRNPHRTRVSLDLTSDNTVMVPAGSQGTGAELWKYLKAMGLNVKYSPSLQLSNKGALVSSPNIAQNSR